MMNRRPALPATILLLSLSLVLAAASIGQVHRAQAADGRELAIKIQYPGIARSIDSDVDNVAALLRLANLLPIGLDVSGLAAEAKRQLRQEADYALEAHFLARYRALVALRWSPRGRNGVTYMSLTASEKARGRRESPQWDGIRSGQRDE